MAWSTWNEAIKQLWLHYWVLRDTGRRADAEALERSIKTATKIAKDNYARSA